MIDPIIIIVPLVLITLFVGMMWMIYVDYKVVQKKKHDRMLEMIPCLCGHSKWIHHIADQSNGLKRSGCHDFYWNSPCRCRAYKMDNLAYLEKIEAQENA
jgi:hypothetical protein